MATKTTAKQPATKSAAKKSSKPSASESRASGAAPFAIPGMGQMPKLPNMLKWPLEKYPSSGPASMSTSGLRAYCP